MDLKTFVRDKDLCLRTMANQILLLLKPHLLHLPAEIFTRLALMFDKETVLAPTVPLLPQFQLVNKWLHPMLQLRPPLASLGERLLSMDRRDGLQLIGFN